MVLTKSVVTTRKEVVMCSRQPSAVSNFSWWLSTLAVKLVDFQLGFCGIQDLLKVLQATPHTQFDQPIYCC
jgi:hypothetical protein